MKKSAIFSVLALCFSTDAFTSVNPNEDVGNWTRVFPMHNGIVITHTPSEVSIKTQGGNVMKGADKVTYNGVEYLRAVTLEKFCEPFLKGHLGIPLQSYDPTYVAPAPEAPLQGRTLNPDQMRAGYGLPKDFDLTGVRADFDPVAYLKANPKVSQEAAKSGKNQIHAAFEAVRKK